ncbi:alpha/beta fold hydrolase [Kribbella sp. NPDC058693]|uniref:alpha/beta fold hydrolase n=1 Tax=Kribbella sp. NPDC058693 TaxID=3346602 RepID=UPI00365B586D
MELRIPVGQDALWTEHLAGDGVPIVFLHPGTGDSRVWDPVVDGLSGRRIVRYDVRGYGRSPLPTAEFSLVDDLVSVLEQLDLQRAVLVGCSMGGGTAISFALTHPDRVHALVLLCPSVRGFPVLEEPDLDAQYDELIANRDVDGLVEFGLPVWAPTVTDDAVVDQLRAAAPAWFEQGMYLKPELPVYDRLNEIHAPTTVMVGDKDRPIAIASAGAAAARIPGSQFTWLPGADHYPSLRNPQLIIDAISNYVAG